MAFVLRPLSNSLDRLHADLRTFGLSRVVGPSADYLFVQDLRQNESVREIWVDPAHRHRIIRIVEILHSQPSLQLDYEEQTLQLFLHSGPWASGMFEPVSKNLPDQLNEIWRNAVEFSSDHTDGVEWNTFARDNLKRLAAISSELESTQQSRLIVGGV